MHAIQKLLSEIQKYETHHSIPMPSSSLPHPESSVTSSGRGDGGLSSTMAEDFLSSIDTFEMGVFVVGLESTCQRILTDPTEGMLLPLEKAYKDDEIRNVLG